MSSALVTLHGTSLSSLVSLKARTGSERLFQETTATVLVLSPSYIISSTQSSLFSSSSFSSPSPVYTWKSSTAADEWNAYPLQPWPSPSMSTYITPPQMPTVSLSLQGESTIASAFGNKAKTTAFHTSSAVSLTSSKVKLALRVSQRSHPSFLSQEAFYRMSTVVATRVAENFFSSFKATSRDRLPLMISFMATSVKRNRSQDMSSSYPLITSKSTDSFMSLLRSSLLPPSSLSSLSSSSRPSVLLSYLSPSLLPLSTSLPSVVSSLSTLPTTLLPQLITTRPSPLSKSLRAKNLPSRILSLSSSIWILSDSTAQLFLSSQSDPREVMTSSAFLSLPTLTTVTSSSSSLSYSSSRTSALISPSSVVLVLSSATTARVEDSGVQTASSRSPSAELSSVSPHSLHSATWFLAPLSTKTFSKPKVGSNSTSGGHSSSYLPFSLTVTPGLQTSLTPAPLLASPSESLRKNSTFISRAALGRKTYFSLQEKSRNVSLSITMVESSSAVPTLQLKSSTLKPLFIVTFEVKLKGNCSEIDNKNFFKISFVATLASLLRISRDDVIVHDVICGSVRVVITIKTAGERNLTSELWGIIKNDSLVIRYNDTAFTAFDLKVISKPTVPTSHSRPTESSNQERKKLVLIIFVLFGAVFAALFVFFTVIFCSRFCACCQKTEKMQMHKRVRLRAQDFELKRFTSRRSQLSGVNYYGDVAHLQENNRIVLEVEVDEEDINDYYEDEFAEGFQPNTNTSLLNSTNHTTNSNQQVEKKFVFDDEDSCSSVLFY